MVHGGDEVGTPLNHTLSRLTVSDIIVHRSNGRTDGFSLPCAIDHYYKIIVNTYLRRSIMLKHTGIDGIQAIRSQCYNRHRQQQLN